jgi:trigger factor
MSLTEGCKREVEIVVPLEDVQRQTDQVVSSVQQKARLPGFRPGKAPASLIRNRFRSEIRQDVVEQLVPTAFRKKAEEEHWKVVGSPNVVEIQFNEGEPLRFKAEFEVAPEFEIGEYRGLEVPYAEPQVSEEDVDKRVEDLRLRKAEFVNEDPRPLQDGDFAVVDLESISGVDGEPVRSEDMSLHLGDPETFPEFTAGLRGVRPDEEREIQISYPEDYAQDRLAGRTVTFRVSVKGVRRRELPELNDEFARDLGDYQTLEELRDAVRAAIRGEREYQAQQQAKQKAVDLLVDAHDFPVPEAYVDRQIEAQLERQFRDLAAEGIDPRQLNLDWSKLREARQAAATRDVRASLLLERIADLEAIHATEDEVNRELQAISKRQREPIAALRMKFEKDGTLGRIAGQIRTSKVLNFLFENSRKVAPPPPSEDPAKPDDQTE